MICVLVLTINIAFQSFLGDSQVFGLSYIITLPWIRIGTVKFLICASAFGLLSKRETESSKNG